MLLPRQYSQLQILYKLTQSFILIFTKTALCGVLKESFPVKVFKYYNYSIICIISVVFMGSKKYPDENEFDVFYQETWRL